MNKARVARVLVLLCLAALLAAAAPAAAKSPAQKRVIPVWAGLKHGMPVEGGLVVARTRGGDLLAPRKRVSASGAVTLLASGKLPRSFVVEVRRKAGKRGARPVLRATVRGWEGPRVVYVNPFSTIAHEYGKLHPRMSSEDVRIRVQRHLGIGPHGHVPESATFWSERAFSGPRFARLARAKRVGGVIGFARRIALRVDGAKRAQHFRAPRQSPQGQQDGQAGKGQGGNGGSNGGSNGGAGGIAGSANSSASELNAKRLEMQRELMAAAQAGMAVVSGNPSALLQIGKLLDALLGGGDTSELREIASQLATLQTGVSQIEQQVAAVDAEVSLAAYSAAVQSYRSTQQSIDLAWEELMHAATVAGEGEAGAAKAEAAALASELKSWGNPIPSSAAVPDDEGAPGLMSWSQNAVAKGMLAGTMTSATQAMARATGFKWWSYWAKDLILHTEKWGNPQTAGAITPANAKRLGDEAKAGLEKAEQHGYGKDLPLSVVYAISSGKLYSVGTVWNLKPTILPPAEGQPDWAGMTTAEASSLPAAAVGLSQAMIGSVPSMAENPNTNMSGKFGPQANDGVAPSFAGSSGGYGLPPAGTHVFALRSTGAGDCEGRWNWLINGQGSSNTTGAPIIEICPAYDATKRTVVAYTCTQVIDPGQFFGWSNEFPLANWSGIWRREKAIQFTTCSDYDHWNEQSEADKSLNWGTGWFAGSAPLSRALNISDAPSAYYGLWTRPISPGDEFLVGPVTNSG